MPFKMKSLMFMLISFVAIANLFGCDKSLEKKPPNYPDALILLPDATDVKYYQLGGTFQLTYKITADYPATDLIETISTKLKQDKWNALKEDYLNPGLQTSHVRGWTSFEDWTKNPPQIVNAWQADWENQAGDIVIYGFQYQYEKKQRQDLRHLTVIAVFVPAPLAKQTREQALEFGKKYNMEKEK